MNTRPVRDCKLDDRPFQSPGHESDSVWVFLEVGPDAFMLGHVRGSPDDRPLSSQVTAIISSDIVL